MIFRWSILSVLLLAGVAVSTNKGFDCEFDSDLHHHFDLHPLMGERTLTVTRHTPPSTMIDELRFNLCADLVDKAHVPVEDQCHEGTRACLVQTNEKAELKARVTAAIPLVTDADLTPDYHELAHTEGVSILFHGPAYPSPHDFPHEDHHAIRQYLNLTLICTPDTTSDPVFLSYDALTGEAHVEWHTTAGCFKDPNGKPHHPDFPEGHHPDPHHEPIHHDDPHHEDDHYPYPHHDDEEGGFGGFFFICFLAIAAYLGVGAYYNHKNYGARGWDLVPHKAFWRELPKLIADLVSHLSSSVRPRDNGRGAYHAV